MAAHSHDKEHDATSDDGALEGVQPRHWKEAPAQPRVKPQWDPAALASKYLDDMEKGGRLHHRHKRG